MFEDIPRIRTIEEVTQEKNEIKRISNEIAANERSNMIKVITSSINHALSRGSKYCTVGFCVTAECQEVLEELGYYVSQRLGYTIIEFEKGGYTTRFTFNSFN